MKGVKQRTEDGTEFEVLIDGCHFLLGSKALHKVQFVRRNANGVAYALARQ